MPHRSFYTLPREMQNLDVFLPYIRKTELCACNWCVVVPFDRGKGQKAQQSRSTLVDSRRCYSRTGSDTKLKVWWLNNQVSVYAWCEFQRIRFTWSRIKICERSETPKFWIFRFLGIAVVWKPICGKHWTPARLDSGWKMTDFRWFPSSSISFISFVMMHTSRLICEVMQRWAWLVRGLIYFCTIFMLALKNCS